MTQVRPDLIEAEVERAVDVKCGPGDLVLFNQLLVHRGGENSTHKVRWSLDWRYQDADKPTHREEQGHIVLATPGHPYETEVVQTRHQWAERRFC